MKKYWVERDRIKPHHLQLIDYNAINTSSRAITLNMKRFSAKWACKCIGTGKNMERWKLRHVGSCPYCLHPKEHTRHIFLCPNVHSIIQWNKAIYEMMENRYKLDTYPVLIKAMYDDINAWRHSTPFPTNDNDCPIELKQIILQQQELGWRLFFEGMTPVSWSKYMDRYYKTNMQLKSANTWAGKVWHILS